MSGTKNCKGKGLKVGVSLGWSGKSKFSVGCYRMNEGEGGKIICQRSNQQHLGLRVQGRNLIIF